MRPRGLIERRLSREMLRPPTIRQAGRVIVSVTGVTVIVSGVLMRVFDHTEFPTIGLALWWALQTVTTVGYGDIVPKETTGRVVAAAVMLEGIAFITITTAAITSTFIERARRERRSVDAGEPDPVQDALASLDARLERIEQRLAEL